MMLPSAKLSHKAFPAPRCRLSPKGAGGMLTDAQIDVLTKEIRSRWSQTGILDAASAPPYTRKLIGDAQRGEAAYKTFLRILPRSGRSRWTKGQRHLRLIPFSRWSAIRLCGRS